MPLYFVGLAAPQNRRATLDENRADHFRFELRWSRTATSVALPGLEKAESRCRGRGDEIERPDETGFREAWHYRPRDRDVRICGSSCLFQTGEVDQIGEAGHRSHSPVQSRCIWNICRTSTWHPGNFLEKKRRPVSEKCVDCEDRAQCCETMQTHSGHLPGGAAVPDGNSRIRRILDRNREDRCSDRSRAKPYAARTSEVWHCRAVGKTERPCFPFSQYCGD